MALGKLYITNQNWALAQTQFFQCLKILPNSLKAHYYLAIVDLKLSDSPATMTKYENFLKRTGLKESDRLKELVYLAQYMTTPKMTMTYLAKAKRFPALSSFVQEENIKTKFIYRTIKESDFPSPVPPGLKFYYQMYLISHGEARRMMMLPTKRKDFPEFWKVFICWRTGIKSWKKSADMILKRDKSNQLITGIVNLLRKRISPSDAVPLIDELPYQDKPLMAIMVAEVYYREGKIYNSELFFKQALNYSPPNIYIQLAKFLKKNK
jgi:tetratricopeptide (TPR) repeat protein